MTRTQARRRRRGGFTLIEVLLVLAILVIIASLAVTAYGPIQRRAKVDAAKSQVGALVSAVDLYNHCLDGYPTNLEALRSPPPDLLDPTKWDGPYLTKPLAQDPWGNDYKFLVPGVRNVDSYDVWSIGPDGVDGTDDDIGNW